VSVGQIVTSATSDQVVPALKAGTYFFRCDVHHDMTGTIVAK
jgi:plastocyanin